MSAFLVTGRAGATVVYAADSKTAIASYCLRTGVQPEDCQAVAL